MPKTTVHKVYEHATREIRLGGADPRRPNTGSASTPYAAIVAQGHAAHPQVSIGAERAKAARIFADAKRRAAKRDATHARASAMIEARAEVASVGYVPEDGREDVVRIMVERSLSVDDAFEAWAAASPSMPVGSRGGRAGGR